MKNGLCFSRGHFRTTNVPVLCRPSLSLFLIFKKKNEGGGAYRVHFVSAPVDFECVFAVFHLEFTALSWGQ